MVVGSFEDCMCMVMRVRRRVEGWSLGRVGCEVRGMLDRLVVGGRSEIVIVVDRSSWVYLGSEMEVVLILVGHTE